MAHYLINRFGDRAQEHVADCIQEAAIQRNDSAVLLWDRIFNVITLW
jgi:hypothetical protein